MIFEVEQDDRCMARLLVPGGDMGLGLGTFTPKGGQDGIAVLPLFQPRHPGHQANAFE
jgi:hypothetical protein